VKADGVSGSRNKNATQERDRISEPSHRPGESLQATRRASPNLKPKRKENEKMTTQEIVSKVKELRELQALIEEAQAEAETTKDAIKANMGGSDVLLAGEYKITWKAVESRRLDTAALSKALPELAAQFTKTTTVRRFCIA
jgi:phage-related protein predicted endonuclease-like protein